MNSGSTSPLSVRSPRIVIFDPAPGSPDDCGDLHVRRFAGERLHDVRFVRLHDQFRRDGVANVAELFDFGRRAGARDDDFAELQRIRLEEEVLRDRSGIDRDARALRLVADAARRDRHRLPIHASSGDRDSVRAVVARGRTKPELRNRDGDPGERNARLRRSLDRRSLRIPAPPRPAGSSVDMPIQARIRRNESAMPPPASQLAWWDERPTSASDEWSMRDSARTLQLRSRHTDRFRDPRCDRRSLGPTVSSNRGG